MLFAEFHNSLRILLSLDGFAVAEAGVLFEGAADMAAFHGDPFRWLMKARDEDKLRVWRLIEARLPGDVLPTPAHAEAAAHFVALIGQARESGTSWWADLQFRQIAEKVERDHEIARLSRALETARDRVRLGWSSLAIAHGINEALRPTPQRQSEVV